MTKRKIAYGATHHGFYLNATAVARGRVISGDPAWASTFEGVPRHDATLIKVIEELGQGPAAHASPFGEIRIVEKAGPYVILNYDGEEVVMTVQDFDWIE